MPTFIDSKNKKHDFGLLNLFYINSELNYTFLIVYPDLKLDLTKYYKVDDDGCLKEINRKPKEEWINLAYNLIKINTDYTSYIYGIPKELKGNMLSTVILHDDSNNDVKFDLTEYYNNRNSKPATKVTKTKKSKIQ